MATEPVTPTVLTIDEATAFTHMEQLETHVRKHAEFALKMLIVLTADEDEANTRL